jgi:MFS family permease
VTLTYRDVLALPGGRRRLFFGLIGRAPTSLFSVALLLLIEEATGSYSVAGVATAAFALALALVAPISGRLVDRHGQRMAGRSLALASALATGSMVLGLGSIPIWLTVALCAVMGGSLPLAATYARTQWLTVTDSTERVLAPESVLHEVNWLVGPPLAAILARTAGAALPVVLGSACSVIGIFGITAGGNALGARPAGSVRRRGPVVGWNVMVVVLWFGMCMNALTMVVVAYDDVLGGGWAPWFFVINGIASLVSGLAAGRFRFPGGPRRGMAFFASVYLVGIIPLVAGSGVPWFLIAAYTAGVAVAPIFLYANSEIALASPRDRRTEAFGMLAASVGIGLAIGAAVGGYAVDLFGAAGARWVLLGLSSGLAASGRFALKR